MISPSSPPAQFPLQMLRVGVAALWLLLLFVSCATTFSSASVASGPHLADVNILLPPKMTHPVEYRLQGTDGCFDWSWDHHDVLTLLPEYNTTSRCSTSARLKSIAPYTGRKETAVYATDLNTRRVTRCKVFIDIFSRIQIFHSSIKLDLDGLATLRVRAFDSEENIFSSLVGLQFTWQLMTETDGLPHHLVHVPLKDSPLSDCGGLCGDLDIQVGLEDIGVFSDLYVVKGIEIGHEIISVHVSEPSFEHLQDKIVLIVAEAMYLDPPSPVFVLVGAVVFYNLKVIRGNAPQVVSLPSPFHQWSVLNSSVAQVDRMVGETHALSLGQTTLIVEDTRVAGHAQTSSLHVVLPDSLLLYLTPLSASGSPIEGIQSLPSTARWYIISGRQYLVQVKVFSQASGQEEIYITESDDIIIYDEQSEFWNILATADIVPVKKSTIILEAISYGLGKLMATLTYSSGHDNRKEVIKIVQEIMVCGEVKFNTGQDRGDLDRILLPWAPEVSQELELRVMGGCGMASSDYKWFSSDVATVSVSASGILQSKGPGKATIKVVSIYDSLNCDEIFVEVYFPSSMVMLQNFPVEFPVGSHIQTSVTLKPPHDSTFERCNAFCFSIKWETESDSFTVINATGKASVSGELKNLDLQKTSVGPPCAWAYVHASSAGRTMLHATLTKEYQQLDHSVSGFVALKASLLIAAYKPLRLLQASDGNQFGGYSFNSFNFTKVEADNQLKNLDFLYLVPGTNFDVVLNGGPEWWGHGVEFFETVESLDRRDSYLKVGGLVHQEHRNYGKVYKIDCNKLGNFKLIFKLGNLIGDNHPLPTVSEVHLLLMCNFPSSIVIIADEATNSLEAIQSAAQADRIEGKMRTTPITVANGRTIRVSAVGITDTGEPFANASSLQLDWKLVDCDGLASWDDSYISATTKSSWERFLMLQNSSGLCTVRATVIGLVDSVNHHKFITTLDGEEIALTDAVRLQIVSSLRVNREFSLLFFSKDAKLNLSIAGGSCFLETYVNDSRILEVIQPPSELQCSQLMLAPKGLGTALVTVYDIELAPSLAATSIVQVADIDWIKIASREEISLVEGGLISIGFIAGTDEGHIFDSSQYVYMQIRVHFEHPIIELVDDFELENSTDGYVQTPNFTIRGRHLGVTALYLTGRQYSGHEVLSQPIKMEIYSPPRIHPNEIFLVPGASYGLKVRGGPKFGVFVEYASMDDKTAKFQKSSGRVSAVSPGNTTLVATFYGKGNIVICQAYGKIVVGIPSAARLNVQSMHLAVGRQMPIFPSLSEGNLFSFYELCSNFTWSIENEEVLIFVNTHHVQGVTSGVPLPRAYKYRSTGNLDEEDTGFLQILQGLSPGKTNVAVAFSCNFVASDSFSESRLYTAHISLLVVPDLPLALGSPITWILPPHYTSSDVLPLAPNPHSRGNTSSQKGSITYSLLREYDQKKAEALDEAMYIAGGKISTKKAGAISCILAKDRSTGRTEIACCVRVAEVAQVRIMAEDVLVLTLAIGAELSLPINFFDVLGNPFHEACNVTIFDTETNYPDVVTIEDTCDCEGRIHLRAIGHGKALVQVSFVNNPRKLDYVMIIVGAHLHPSNPVLRLGSHLNFSINGLPGHASGYWFSSNDSIVYVDKLSGKAEAMAEGSTRVHYEGSDLRLHTTVTVLQGYLLTVDAPKEMLTNVLPFPEKGYLFPVKLADGYNHTNEKKLFDCEVDPPYIGFAKPWSDPVTGMWYCIFFPHFPEDLARTAPDSADMRQGLSISIHASLVEDKSISGSASADFVGGFSLLGSDAKSVKLNLTPDSNRGYITIVGNTDVKISWHHGDKLSVKAMQGEVSKERGHATYEAKVHSDTAFKDELIITLPATGQKVRLEVYYEARKREGATITFSRLLVLAIVVALFCCLVGCLVYRGLTPPFPAPNSTTLVAASAPSTPVQSRSPPVRDDHSQSPRAPQPFIDYVRRTIDETPYYRQDFRRRVNMQNSM